MGTEKQLSIRDFPAGITVTCTNKVVMTYDGSEAFSAGRDYVIASNHAGAEPAHVRMINNQGVAHRMGLEHLCHHFKPTGQQLSAPDAPVRTGARTRVEPHQQEVLQNVELIQAYSQGHDLAVSSSQLLMVGLALCRPTFIEDARYPTLDARSAWRALDNAQRKAILHWWNRS